MGDRTLLTPFFLDSEVPGLRAVADAAWMENRPTLPPGERQDRMAALYEPIATFVADTLAVGDRPISFAGDCCAALGMAAGLQRAGVRPTLVWLDAHGDFNTWETTPSGFLGGMPLAMLVGLGDLQISRALGLAPLPAASVILTDARDLDPGEREAVAASDLRHMPDITAVAGALPAGPLWVHFDVDVLRLEDVPAVSYPAAGGPDAEAVGALCARLADTGRVVAVSVSAWNPVLPGAGASESVVMSLLASLTGAA